MRTIRKRNQPVSLTQWRAARLVQNPPPGMDCTYDALRNSPAVIDEVEEALFAEQGGLCAYTGRRIMLNPGAGGQRVGREVGFHVEHVQAQTHCRAPDAERGADTDYRNMVACWPPRNQTSKCPYGAQQKDSWPVPAEMHHFVSPLRDDCSARFTFDDKGLIVPAQANDGPARQTIDKLKLNHPELKDLRAEAMKGAVKPGGRFLRLQQVRKALAQMEQNERDLDAGATVQLPPYCFALRAALARQIGVLERLMAR